MVDDRLAAVGELVVSEVEAGDRPGRHQRGDIGLEHHLVGDPDGAEEAEPLRVAAHVGEDRLHRRPGQRPPLRAEARLEPGREAPPHPERRLDARREPFERPPGLVVEPVPVAPALRAPAPRDPALVLGFDEFAPGVLEKEALEARHRPAGQAGARQQDRVVGRPSPAPAPSASAWASALSGASTRPKPPQRQATRRATRPIRGSSATAAASPSKARASARASKWISARASEPAATRVRASSATSAGRSWARITNRSFIEGRRLPSDMRNGHSGLGAGPA